MPSWYKDLLGWRSIRTAACWLRHGTWWKFRQMRLDIDEDIAEYWCPHCQVLRVTQRN